MTVLDLEITRVSDTAPGIKTFALASPRRAPLPSFTPGSHVVLECGPAVNAYSLVGDQTMPDEYVISVLRDDDGAGGSRWLHERTPGDVVAARLPRSLFAPVRRARKHLLLAAGIGVTPIVSHARSAAQWGLDAEVLYIHRAGRGAHARDLAGLASAAETLDLTTFTDRAAFARHLDDALGRQPIGTHLYCCGPEDFMDAVCDRAARLGWPDARIHTERFGAETLDPGEPFDVDLTESGDRMTVPAGTSLLDALNSRGHRVPYLCKQGFCGECRIPVSRGTPLHRDHFLTDDEKADSDCLMACVSRAHESTLEIPL